MAEFKIKNQDVFHFARFNYKAVEENGLVAFDGEDYLNIVQSGKTEYIVSCGDSCESAWNALKDQLSDPAKANCVFLAIETCVDFAKAEEIDRLVDNVRNAMNAQTFFWNVYPTPEKSYFLHLLINRK